MNSSAKLAQLAVDAVVDDEALHATCEELRRRFGAIHHLFVEHRGEPICSEIVHSTFSEQAVTKYVQHYSTTDLWAIEAMRRPRPFVVLGDDLVPERVFLESEGHQDFCRPYLDGVGHLLAVSEPTGRKRYLALSLLRATSQRPFEEHDKLRLRRLAPMLRGLIRARATLREMVGRSRLGFRGLDVLGIPIFIVDAAARVVFANPAAQALATKSASISLWTGQGYRIGDLGVRFAGERDQLALAVRTVAGGSAPSRQLLLAAGAADARWIVELLRVPDSSSGGERSHAMLVVHRPGDRDAPDAALLTQVFALTAAEARIALAIAGGVTVQDYADQHRLSLETVRSQIKSTFSKLGINRQADLVRMVLSLGAGRNGQRTHSA